MDKELKSGRSTVIGFLATLLALFAGLSLATYNKWDPSPFTYTNLPPQNYGGMVGAYIADVLISVLGTSAYALPLVLFFYAARRFTGASRRLENIVGVVLMVISLSINFSLMGDTFEITIVKGGLIGSSISYILQTFLSTVVAFIISLSVLYTSIVLLIPMSLSTTPTYKKDSRKEDLTERVSLPRDGDIGGPRVDRPRVTEAVQPKKAVAPVTNAPAAASVSKAPVPKKPVQAPAKAPEPPPTLPKDAPAKAAPPRRPTAPKIPEARKGQYLLPPAELLSSEHTDGQAFTKEEILRGAANLQELLSDFGADGNIVHVSPGPIVTMYEFEPASGVKLSKVVSLSDDLGRAMGGLKVRVSLISGKAPVGIEVPNEVAAVVTLKEIIHSDRFAKRSALLTMSMGIDIYGNPVVEELSRLSHLLMAGTTGCGKSVVINAMILSILYKVKPSQVKMLIIDPKLLELSMYNGIPHLLSHVITSPGEASDALARMLLEMDRRYRHIATQGAKNIEMFNAGVAEEDKLPYIVVVINELADLIFTSARGVEESIVRLAQMGRGAGIHLIVATQHPTADVITSEIKSSFPSRVAFMVSSKVDSRTILDTHGAEKLLGRGDMLLLTPGARLMRVHGAYVSEDEVKAVTDYVKAQGKPDYTAFNNLRPSEPVTATPTAERDEMYKEVVRYAQTIGEISIASIQRRFKIGYNQAAQIMEMMEEDGLVGPPKGGGKPRNFASG
ncbi:MAG: DNA translocase FtsK 4TM domain-containing protein [Nitrospirae bacterium]|uniref:DNA translocase FtsK n=1 Tax=Candidatus Magnetobacterium casense TaxID=1455061 RepID=UPI000697563C|nr:DNA translocase FtsK [Candidatus Magnetobacterium casensis]MBF0338313.1 DNA translocase FtsK 4TM domain-containing protein [Nitrospirota bacterium]